MIRRTKRTIIKTQTREIFIVRRAGESSRIFRCDECRRDAEWLTLAASAKISGFGLREIFRLIETGAIHFEETTENQLLVCKNSLAAARRAEPPK